MAKRKKTATRKTTRSTFTPATSVTQAAALRRELARQRQIKQLSRQLLAAEARADLALVQAARELITVRGWSVVRSTHLEEVERTISEQAQLVTNLREQLEARARDHEAVLDAAKNAPGMER